MSGTVRVGRAERFRPVGGVERLVRRLRGGVPSPLRPLLRRGYELALESLPGDQLVSTFPGGERVRLSARYRNLSWNPEEYAAFRSAVRPGDVVIDAGANVGAYTLLFAQWVGPTGRVFAFEPAPASRAALERHLRLNRLIDRVEIVPAAVSVSTGTAAFTLDGFGGASALRYDGSTSAAAHAIEVPTTTLDAFCAARAIQPAVVKIDVEGAELEALQGAREVIARGVRHLFVEFHPGVWRARGIARADVERELQAQRLAADPLDASFDVWATEGICARLCRTT